MALKTKVLNLFRTVFKIPILEKLIRSLVVGKDSTHFISRLAPNNYQYKTQSFRTFNYKGVFLRADIRDYVGHFLYFGFKDEGQDVLINMAKSGSVVFDIGTNIGSTLLSFAQKVGEDGIVYGFEPDQENYKNCLENIGLNNFKNIIVENIGLGDSEGEFDLIVDTETNRGGNRISNQTEELNSSRIKVETLTSWFKKYTISKIDLIKVDVEGYELKVLVGGKSLLDQYQPILFIELDDNNLKAVGDSAKGVILFLEELGYKIFHSTNGSEITAEDIFEDCHYDIIAKHSTSL